MSSTPTPQSITDINSFHTCLKVPNKRNPPRALLVEVVVSASRLERDSRKFGSTLRSNKFAKSLLRNPDFSRLLLSDDATAAAPFTGGRRSYSGHTPRRVLVLRALNRNRLVILTSHFSHKVCILPCIIITRSNGLSVSVLTT